jgi:hypothetical protein
MPNGILSDEFQQRWIPKVVPAFENDLLMHKSGMLIQVCTQTRHVTCIEELHGMAKCRIFNSLLVRQIQSIGERWFFNVPFQPRPAGKSMFAGDCKLCIAEAELCVEDFSVRGPVETRMEFPEPLGRCLVAGIMILEQVFRLISEVIEVGIRWEASYRHDELPFVCPRSAIYGQKVSS